jgi:membrane protein YqaA with SNARE-associated domain
VADVETRAGLLFECRAAWDWWERFSCSRGGVVLMFVWAVAEAIVWPIIPEFLLVPMAAGNRQRFYQPLAAAIAGTALGGIALYLFAFTAPASAMAFLAWLPLIGRGSVAAVQSEFAAHGAVALLVQPLSGIPFKVWALIGGASHISPWRAIPIFVFARGLRMTLFATASRTVAGLFTGFFRDYSLFLLGIYLLLFLCAWWLILRR